jgi:TetR/AcrR family transcriptional regulator, mexJK operon transcriptional repressor
MGRRPKVSRDEVLAAAREAFAERGFAATTLTSIAARLDVSAAALLRHAATKEELFASCMAPGVDDETSPIDFLAELDGSEDPRLVLRRIGRAFVPFFERKFAQQVAGFMHARAADRLAFPPFADHPRPTPPQRNFERIAEYFRRAVRAGTLRVGDPEAAALTFVASLHAYVVMQRLAQVPDPPIELERYLDTLLEIWDRGAIAAASLGKRP